jgi:hypothetical protein
MTNAARNERRRAAIEQWRATFGDSHQYEAWKYVRRWWVASDAAVGLLRNAHSDPNGASLEISYCYLSIAALWQFRVAAVFTQELLELDISSELAQFDEAAKCLKAFRNTVLHFEDYEIGLGRAPGVSQDWDDAQIGHFSLSQCDCFYKVLRPPHEMDIIAVWRCAQALFDAIIGDRLHASMLPRRSETICTEAFRVTARVL